MFINSYSRRCYNKIQSLLREVISWFLMRQGISGFCKLTTKTHVEQKDKYFRRVVCLKWNWKLFNFPSLCFFLYSEFSYKSIKIGLSSLKKNCIVWFYKIPLKMTNNSFHFTLKAVFVVKVFKLLSCRKNGLIRKI